MEGKDKPKFDLFISYVDADYAWVKGYLLDALDAAGITYHTETAFELGKPRLLAFEEAIEQSKRILLVLSPAYLLEDSTLFIELLAQSYGQETGTWPVIPLVLQSVKLPTRLGMLTRIEVTAQEDWAPAIERLTETLGRPVPSPAPIPPPPYPGMRTFSEADRDLFYGRDEAVDDLIRLMRKQSFLALIGPSGSGKSSLVYAGLVPALRNSSIFGPGACLIQSMRPGEDPLKTLTDTLGGDLSQLEARVSALLSTHPDTQRLLLIVDQFEELFTVAESNIDSFQETLIHLTELPNVYIILTVRADFYAELMSAPLWSEIQKHRYEVLPLDEQELAQAIAKPAEEVDVYVEPTLVERLVADAGREPGILPFLQETMILLWEKVERRYLPLSAYEALVLPRRAYEQHGSDKLTGLQAAIALHADAVLDDLSEEQHDIARRIFVRLVQFGEGRPDTRRQQPVFRLQAVTNNLALFERTLADLANEQRRLLTLSGDEEDQERKVDIAHEALIAAWPKLRTWLDEDREVELALRRLEDDARQWLAEKRNDFYLYQGTRLEDVRTREADYADRIGEEVQTFLDASRRRDARRKLLQRTFRVMVGLFALFGLASALFFARQEALRLSARSPIITIASGPAILGVDNNLVDMPAFSMGQYEVTYRQYRLCMQAGPCLHPNEPADFVGIDEADERLPVVWVNAFQAATFCAWVGRRLPTQAEWERAVRGQNGRTWPWGEEEPTPKHVNIFLPEFVSAMPSGDQPEGMPEGLAPVNDSAFANGATPEPEGGITHLLGNAREWTSTSSSCDNPYNCPNPWDGQQKVRSLNLVGRAWTDDLLPNDAAWFADVLPASPILFDENIGFRCADS